MNYHLSSQGQNLGNFPIEELRRRRGAGELNGTEFVWCDGMPDWLPLDTVLQATAPAARRVRPTPPPIPPGQRKSKRAYLWMAMGVVGLAVVIAVGMLAVKWAKRLVPTVTQALQAGRTSGVEAANKPIARTASTVTERDVNKKEKAFRERQWLESYEKLGNHAAPCDDVRRPANCSLNAKAASGHPMDSVTV